MIFYMSGKFTFKSVRTPVNMQVVLKHIISDSDKPRTNESIIQIFRECGIKSKISSASKIVKLNLHLYKATVLILWLYFSGIQFISTFTMSNTIPRISNKCLVIKVSLIYLPYIVSDKSKKLGRYEQYQRKLKNSRVIPHIVPIFYIIYIQINVNPWYKLHVSLGSKRKITKKSADSLLLLNCVSPNLKFLKIVLRNMNSRKAPVRLIVRRIRFCGLKVEIYLLLIFLIFSLRDSKTIFDENYYILILEKFNNIQETSLSIYAYMYSAAGNS
uniref:Maturase K n=1 Tax=Heterorhabditis bacteriophora TaxID=37862 RepID=A0A1I7W664_HETBA